MHDACLLTLTPTQAREGCEQGRDAVHHAHPVTAHRAVTPPRLQQLRPFKTHTTCPIPSNTPILPRQKRKSPLPNHTPHSRTCRLAPVHVEQAPRRRESVTGSGRWAIDIVHCREQGPGLGCGVERVQVVKIVGCERRGGTAREAAEGNQERLRGVVMHGYPYGVMQGYLCGSL
jgi:hypothetical protein